MFKLVKILNSGTSAPEIIEMDISPSTAFYKNCVYFPRESTLYPAADDINGMKFIPIEDVPKNSNKRKISGFLVTPEMVFEADYIGDIDKTPWAVGNKVQVVENSNGALDHVGEEIGNDAIVLNCDEMETANKVLVALKW